MDWTRPTLEERREIEEYWLVTKKLYTMNLNCARCLPNGEVIDEAHCGNGQCENCVTTAYEMHPDYAYWVDVNHKRGRFIDTVIELREKSDSYVAEAWLIAEDDGIGHARLTGQEIYDHENPAPLENPMDWEK